MPKLHEYVDGHGYYISGYMHGGGNITYQVIPEGVEILFEHDVQVGVNFDKTLLDELRYLGYAFTRGGGLSGVLAQSAGNKPEWTLAFEESESEVGWGLTVRVPSIPAQWAGDDTYGKLLEKLGGCFMEDGNGAKVSATHLLQGGPNAALTVTPQSGPFQIKRTGPWPVDWKYEDWERPVSGLSDAATLFEGGNSDGARLRPGTQLTPGESYYLLCGPGESGRQIAQSLPVDMLRKAMGRIGGWQGFAITLPASVTSTHRLWCAQIHYRVQGPAWTLAIVSPPPVGYNVLGIPQIAAGEPMVLAVKRPANASIQERAEVGVYHEGAKVGQVNLVDLSSFFKWGKENKVTNPEQTSYRYMALEALEAGAYEIVAEAGRVRPLKFVAMEEQELQGAASTVQPLRIQASESGGAVNEYLAFCGEKQQALIQLNDSVEIRVLCQVPVRVRGKTKHRTPLEEEFHFYKEGEISRLERLLAEIAVNNERAIVVFDAGNFGRIDVVLQSSKVKRGSTSPEIARRLRWVTALLRGLERQKGVDYMTCLPHLRRPLRALGQAGGISLLNRATVPAALIPHLAALERAARDEE